MKMSKLEKVLQTLNNDGITLLEFYGYSTKDEDFEQDQTYQDGYNFLFDIVVKKLNRI